jgi:ABC-type multidrug transport system ATPase subunit
VGTILGVKDLIVRHSNQTVLQVDSLDIQEGEVLAVIGPNGAGKSTLLLVLARLLDPDAGRYFLAGPIQQENELAYRRRIARIQEPLLYTSPSLIMLQQVSSSGPALR